MRRILITLVATLAAIALAAGVSSALGGGSAITRARLERSLPTVFAQQYARQAALLGHDDVTAESVQPRAMCEKGGPDVPDIGPGSDWICLVGWSDPHLPMPPEGYGKFEIVVHPNDCYTAGGPSKLVGFQTLQDRRGRTVPNPAFEFDGCFDPGGDDTPTGVTFPSVLQITSTVLTVDAQGRTGVQVSCGPGAGGCAGTMTVAAGSTTIATVPYELTEQSTPTLVVPVPVPASAADLTFTVAPRVGVAPPKPTTVPLQR